MNRRTTPWSWLVLACLLLGLACAGSALAKESKDTKAKRLEAERLYLEGRYSEALPLLVELDTAGTATGPLLYRLTYCQRKTGDTATSNATERRALETLESELAGSKDLEVPFYLSNIYRNVGRIAEANRVAAETTKRFEDGEIDPPVHGMEMFQLGKLFADLSRDDLATEWYTKAVAALNEGEGVAGPYVRWASRFLAERAYDRQDYGDAQKYYDSLVEAGEGGGPEFERLAIASARVGMYRESAKAWKLVENSGPPDPNRARYASRLCKLASTLKSQPVEAPSGKPWTELSQQELEDLMKSSATEVMAAYNEAEEATEPTKEERRAFRARIKESKTVFVPAALEYTLRGHEIRQFAFFGGFARLILNRGAWKPRWDSAEEEAEVEEEKEEG